MPSKSQPRANELVRRFIGNTVLIESLTNFNIPEYIVMKPVESTFFQIIYE
jgi:hypothetical protein